jgi:8-oxo-dGTP pyrophosphatase MutT (NUDIX family)
MCWWVIDLLGDSLARKRVRFALDNAVSVGIIKNGTSKSPKLMALVRRLYLLSALEDFIVSPWWVQGKMHLRCDGISRGQRPEISGWRVHYSWWCYSQDLMCRPFELIVGGEALYKGVAAGDMQDSPDGKCCWVHPRHDQVAEAIMWVVEASVRDKATCGVLVLPVNPLALWWPMMKHLRVVQFIPSGSHCMEMFSERGWSLRDTRLALMICVFPVMPTMSLIKGRYGAVVARPATRHASLKHERRGTWLVQRMTDGEERDQMLRFPEVPYGLWLYQPISKCSDGVRVNCHLWSKDAPSRYGSGEADLGFKLVQDQKGPFAVRVEDCYVVTPWVADKDDKKKGKVRFDHHQWLRLYGRGAEVSDVSTPILAEAFGARNRELSRLSQAPNSLPPSPSVFPSLPSMTRVSELAASSTTAGRFESRCHGLLERGGFPFSLQLPLQKKQWWTELFAAVREMEECDLLSQLTLLMADAAASYVVEIFTEYAASGLTSLQLAKEDQLLSRMMNLMGANQVDQLPSQISMLVEMRSSVQLTGDEMSGDVSLVWVLPYFFREHCRMQGLSMDATQSYTDNEETQPLPEVSRAHSSHDSLGDPGSTGGSQQGVIRSPAASVDGSQQSSIQRGWYDVAAESLSESQMCGRKWQFGTQDDAISVAASSQATVPDSQHHSSPILLSSGSAISIEDMQDHIEATQSMAKDVECVKESPRPSWRAGCSRASMLVICERGVLVVKGMAESVTDEARGYWTLPGGKVRVGESFKEAAVRKWEEEVGFPLEETVVSFATTVGVTSYYWCTLNASDAAAELADGFASRASKKAIVGWRWHSLVWVASILKSRGGLVDDSTQRESLLWGKDWAFDDVIATEKVVSMMVVNRSAPGGSKESSNLAGRDPDSGPIPMSPQRDLGALPVIPVLMSPPTIMLPPMIHRASNNQGADALRAPSGSYVLCNLPGRCPDCDQPLTLGHPIIKRVPPGMDSARWCHVICRLAGTPPASAALLEDERFPDTPPLQLTYEQKQFSRDAQWIELRFVETIGDWLEPSAKIIEHRYLQSLVAHYGDSVEWEMQGSNLHLGETSVQEWLWERETIVASQAQAPSSIVLYAAASTTDRLWVTDWASLHGSDVFWSWAVHEETMPLESGSGACDMLVPSMSGVGGVKPLTSREQRWIEGHQCGGLRQATHLACWNVPDCGGVLAGVVGHIVCVECEATAHFQCLGVPPPAVSGEQREVTCPNCLIAKCTKNPTDVFRTAMANITLSAAGNDSTNNEKKERKTLVNAVTKYEEEHNLYPSTVLTVPEAGVAFLQSYASAGHVPQMRKMRKAMKRWLGEKKLHDWTEESLAHFILGATAKKLTKGSEQAHKIDRAIIKTAHILLKQKVLAGAMSILVATRTNAGSHCIFGASTRASEISGTDVDHGANTGGVRLGKRKEKLIVTPHAAGAVRGEPRELQCSWFDLEVEDSKMDPGKAVVSVAGETCRRRLEEYAEAWGRSWVTIDNPDTSGDKVEVMDYKVLRVGLSGVVPGTPAGEAFLSALVDTQRAYCFETRFKSEVMLRWLANTARARAQHPDSNKRWINVVDGTISSLERNAKNYAHLLQECYNQKMRTLYLTSEGKQGYAVQAPLIDTAVRWGPLFTNTTGHFSRLQITPMPLSGDSMEKDLKAIWGEACMVLGRGELHPSSHGGRGGACLLARSLAAQAGIDPASMREYVDSHFRWSPEKDRMQILYSGHLPRSERLKITSLFWPVGTEWDY